MVEILAKYLVEHRTIGSTVTDNVPKDTIQERYRIIYKGILKETYIFFRARFSNITRGKDRLDKSLCAGYLYD